MKSFPLLIAFLVSASVHPMNPQKKVTKECPSLKTIITRSFELSSVDEIKDIIKNNRYKNKLIPQEVAIELAIELGKRLIFASESLTVGQKKELIDILSKEKTFSETDKKALMQYKWLIEPLKSELSITHDYIYDKDDIWSEKELKSPFCQNLLFHSLISNVTKNNFEHLLDALLHYVGNNILEVRDNNGKQPLHYAQEYEHLFYLTKKLIGANVNAQDIEGKTPLYDACYYVAAHGGEKLSATLEPLFKAGASNKISDAYGETPLKILRQWGDYPEIEKLFKKYENN